MVVSENASPESLSTTRRYLLSPIRWSSVLADLDAGEAPDGGVLAEVFEQLADRGLGLAHERLLEEHVLLVEAVEPPLDDLGNRVVRLALVAGELLEDGALLVDHICGHVFTAHVARRR